MPDDDRNEYHVDKDIGGVVVVRPVEDELWECELDNTGEEGVRTCLRVSKRPGMVNVGSKGECNRGGFIGGGYNHGKPECDGPGLPRQRTSCTDIDGARHKNASPRAH